MTQTKAKEVTGLEGIKPDRNRGNYLNLLQGLSKQVSEGTGKVGEIFNTKTGEAKKSWDLIAVGYQWKAILYKIDESGNPIEGPKGPEFYAMVTDQDDERLTGRRFYNDKEGGLKKNAVKMHCWKFVIPGESEIYEVAFKGTNIPRHDEILAILAGGKGHICDSVLKLSSKKAEKGPHHIYTVERGRDASNDEAAAAKEVWQSLVPVKEEEGGEIPF